MILYSLKKRILTKRSIFNLVVLFTLLILFSQFTLISTNYQLLKEDNNRIPSVSAQISDTKQWLNNTGFDSSEYWYNESVTDQINPDVNATISNGQGHLDILGNSGNFSVLANFSRPSEWTKRLNPDFPAYPQWGYPNPYTDQGEIREGGFWTRHQWRETPRQTPSVQWTREIELPTNLSDYIITNAEVSASFNATVNTNVDANTIYGDTINANPDGDTGSSIGIIYDYVRFYIRISDPDFDNVYQIADNRTYRLGAPGVLSYIETDMNVISEESLIFYLTSVLSKDFRNFTVIIGIDIFCEDNCDSDRDYFENLYIKSFNLNFSYQKKINQFTSVSWNQDGDRISELSPENYTVIATNANLKFQYKIDKNWSIYTFSPNSEINIYLNGNPYLIPIKLIDINTTSFSETNIILPRPVDSVNLSIEVLLKDNFELNQTITISIDNVTLEISYIMITPDMSTNGGGGGGKTRYIRGEDYTWLVILLTAGIIALVSTFVAYQKHYKYPPIVRKIRNLKKKIRKGSKTKPLLLNTREELIKKNFKNQTNLVMETELKPESIDKLKEGGK